MRTNRNHLKTACPQQFLSRRIFLSSLGALTLTPRMFASEPASDATAVTAINHVTSFVPDQRRTVGFYQKLFRMPIDTYQGPLPILRVGTGNQSLAFVGADDRDALAFIDHVCFAVDDFNPDRILATLADFGVTPRADESRRPAPLKSYVTMRMPDRGGAPAGTPELYFTDPDGILLQVQDVRYRCGGGYLGDERG